MKESEFSNGLESPERRNFFRRPVLSVKQLEHDAALEELKQTSVTQDEIAMRAVREKLANLPSVATQESRSSLQTNLIVSATETPKDTVTGRRKFLQFLGRLSVAAMVPRWAKGAESLENKPSFRSEEGEGKVVLEKQEKERKVEVKPEYERTMEEVLLAFPDCRDEEAFREYIEEIYVDILMQLPSYSRFTVMVTENRVALARQYFESAGWSERITFISAGDEGILQHWAQDYGEVINIGGEEKFLVSQTIATEEKQAAYTRAARNSFGKKAEQALFYFEGGNMTFDRTEKGLRVFIGYDDVHRTLGQSETISPQQLESVKEKISETFAGAEVIIVGSESQDKAFFHLDHSFLLLHDKVAVVNEMTTQSDRVSKMLPFNRRLLGDAQKAVEKQREYADLLRSLGYTVKSIRHSREDREEGKTSINAIPFVDKVTGQRKIIFPVFPGEVQGDFEAKDRLRPDELIGKAKEAYAIYKEAGYIPIPVRDRTLHEDRGNLHCLLNVLK